MPTTLISDTSHYIPVLDLAMKVKCSLWIGTADIKDLYVLQGKTGKPFPDYARGEYLYQSVYCRFVINTIPCKSFLYFCSRKKCVFTQKKRIDFAFSAG